MGGDLYDAVGLAYQFILPPMLGMLGVCALGRDRVSSGLLVGVFLAFAFLLGWQALDDLRPLRASSPAEAVLWLWPISGLGLGGLLYRDRRNGHVRTTFESLLVLGCGAILLAALLSMPDWRGDAWPRGA